MKKILFLFMIGGVGTLGRYWIQGWTQRKFGAAFPVGTLVVNLLGCLAFGFVWALAEERMIIRPELRIVILIGFLGAFTTFSSYAFETVQLARDSQWVMVVANVLLQNILGLGTILVGMFLGRLL